YNNWKRESALTGAGRYLSLNLGWVKGLSPSRFAKSSGQATIDLAYGSISIEVKGLPNGEWDFWLISNRPGPGYSTMPDPGDAMINAGTFMSDNSEAKLETRLAPEALSGVQID